ncbi:hypothetical protein AMTRI_Chr10g229840 [Amborella trichopoda]
MNLGHQVAAYMVVLAGIFTISGHAHPSLNFNLSGSAWSSFYNLSGCHKGEHVPGLTAIKQYLHTFGYIPQNLNFTDDFDDSLESAIKTYQQNFRLNATGSLDSGTVRQMMSPRCGVPDVVNGTTTMMRSRGLSSVMRYTFFPGNPRWPVWKRNLTYAIRPGTFSTSDDTAARAVFARAFARWAAATTLSFTESTSYSTADIRIAFFGGDHGDGEPFDGALGTLAHAFSPPDGRLHLDAAELWVVSGNSRLGIDLESVAVHEIGHVLGLGHSSDEAAIMFPTITTGTRRVELATDDIMGIQELYGANSNAGSTASSPVTQENEQNGAGNKQNGAGGSSLGSVWARAGGLVLGALLLIS